MSRPCDGGQGCAVSTYSFVALVWSHNAPQGVHTRPAEANSSKPSKLAPGSSYTCILISLLSRHLGGSVNNLGSFRER